MPHFGNIPMRNSALPVNFGVHQPQENNEQELLRQILYKLEAIEEKLNFKQPSMILQGQEVVDAWNTITRGYIYGSQTP